MRTYITVRIVGEAFLHGFEQSLDKAISYAIEQLALKASVPMSYMDLVSATPFFFKDGSCFVTVIAEQSAQVPLAAELVKAPEVQQ